MEQESVEEYGIDQVAQAICVLAQRGQVLARRSGMPDGAAQRFAAAFEGIEDLAGQIPAEPRMPHTERR